MVGTTVNIGVGAVDAYNYVTADTPEEKEAAKAETKKDVGGMILGWGLTRINPVLGASTIMYDYYTNDKEWILNQFNMYKERANLIDASQDDREQLYNFEDKYRSVIYGDLPKKETTISQAPSGGGQ